MTEAPTNAWFNMWGGIWTSTHEGRFTCSWYPECPNDPSKSGIRIVGQGDDIYKARNVLYNAMFEYMWSEVTKE